MDVITEVPAGAPPTAPLADAPPVAEAPVKEPTIREHAEATQPSTTVHRRRAIDDARPDEREEIGTLTKRLRDAEEATGIKRKPTESNRVYDLRLRTELAERLRDAGKPTEKSDPTPPPPPAAPRAASPVEAFTEKEPTLDQFKDDADPATAYFRALARFELKQEQHAAKQAEAETASKAVEAAQRGWWAARGQEHTTRLETFVTANPTARATLEAIGDKPLSPILFAAIQIHPDSPKLMMALATRPELHDELFLLTDGKPIGDPTRNPLIGIVQRRLMTQAQTGQVPERSPASAWKPPAPPPSPVRTQPTAITAPSKAEDGKTSILAHAKKFYARD